MDCRKEKLQRITRMVHRGEVLDIHTAWGTGDKDMNHTTSNNDGSSSNNGSTTTSNDINTTTSISSSSSSSSNDAHGSSKGTGCMLDERVFHVAISDFYVDKEGDGVDAFSFGRIVADHGQLISHCVVEYIKGYPVEVVEGEPPGRLVLLG